ncbi:MAG: hypothetical protein JXB04_02065 [Kiritimatiellae bacterium]|nr:hypothetical protein [Kiritimatiellia bacterium]
MTSIYKYRTGDTERRPADTQNGAAVRSRPARVIPPAREAVSSWLWGAVVGGLAVGAVILIVRLCVSLGSDVDSLTLSGDKAPLKGVAPSSEILP